MQRHNEMTRWERVRAALVGEPTDRVPVALWRHFPPEDEIPESLAEATLGFQRKYEWDLVKMTPTGTYGIVDWGAETAWIPNDTGVRTVTRFGLTSPDSWARLEQLDVTRGYLANQNIALGLVAKDVKGDAPLLQTVFSPLTTARKLAGDRIFTDLRETPDLLHQGLEIITEVTSRFAQEAIKSGASGFFFATQQASSQLMPAQEYQNFGERYDLQVLQSIRSQSEIIILHLHGEDIFFDLANRYPIDAVNWHDRVTPPSLAAALTKTTRTLAGGINEWQTLQTGPVEAIHAEVRQAIQSVGGRRLILAPGCVIPRGTPESHIQALRQAVNIYQPS